jgi:hypothetical protein
VKSLIQGFRRLLIADGRHECIGRPALGGLVGDDAEAARALMRTGSARERHRV